MSKSDRIRQLLTKGVEVKEIAKRLKVSPNLVHQVKWQAKKNKAMPERSTDPKVQKVEKKYIKKATRLYKSAILTKKEVDALLKPMSVKDRLIKELEAAEKKLDIVNSPPHYRAGGVETIDFIEAKDLNYRLGNVVKYVSRAGKKNSDPVQDLEKAAWYLNREIEARKSA
jgi:transposase-like protein